MVKNAFILLIFIFLSEVLFSCFWCRPEDYRLDLAEITTNVYEMKDTTFCHTENDSLICGDSKLQVLQTDSAMIRSSQFKISMKLVNSKGITTHFNPSFFTQAYACQENEYLGLSTPIETFEIRCNQHILNTEAGSLIDNEKLLFDRNFYGEGFSVSEWMKIANGNQEDGTYPLFENEDSFITFKEPIVSSEYLTFEITVILENDEKYTTTTIPVKIIE